VARGIWAKNETKMNQLRAANSTFQFAGAELLKGTPSPEIESRGNEDSVYQRKTPSAIYSSCTRKSHPNDSQQFCL
jgi:hypothetical protein